MFIILDLHKQYYKKGQRPPLYFWRDNNGYIEVDCLINNTGNLTPIEIKSGKTSNADYFKGIEKWIELTKIDPSKAYIIYAGPYSQSTSKGRLLEWKKVGNLVKDVENIKFR